MNKLSTVLAGIVGGLGVLFVLSVLFGWLVSVIWNAVPFLEAVQHLTVWHGFLLNILCGLLFRNTAGTK